MPTCLVAAFDFMTLKLAIHFIAPAVAIYALVSVSAPVLTLAAESLVKLDVSQDKAVCLFIVDDYFPPPGEFERSHHEISR
ncbi:hypothetical protein [Roseimaritima sediminicola]|uniref:hypothetical protein n=1 Tax=Roseimaritima sediminicola TaxID=2662066 RepID=UPI0012984256|nr:hypothetical protein [Roseimaritima sediminicola]